MGNQSITWYRNPFIEETKVEMITIIAQIDTNKCVFKLMGRIKMSINSG